MMKKILSIVMAVCILTCSICVVSAEEDIVQSVVFYDMIEKGTWEATNDVISIDSTRFSDRGEVICSNVGSSAGVTLYDALEEPIRKGKIRVSFEFYADEAYNGFPEFYLSLANMVPFDRKLNWNCTPAFFPQADGKVKYYGGRGSTGSIDWGIYNTNAIIEKGRWYKMETIVDFDNMGRISGYLDSEKLYELNGSTVLTGLLFVIAGKANSNGKLYLDNITVSSIQNDLSASFAYGEGDNIVIEFTQPITAKNASDVKAIDTTTGETVEILEISQVSGNRISYKMPSGKPYAEYQLVFGDKNISDYGSAVYGNVKVVGSVGVPEEGRIEIPSEKILLEDNFNAYNTMSWSTNTLTLNSDIWVPTGDVSTNVWWGMGPLVNGDKKLQIHCFHGSEGDVRGIKGKVSDSAQKSGIVAISFDMSFDEVEPEDKNGARVDIVSNGTAYPILDVKAENISLYETQVKGEELKALTQVTKENNDAAKKYEFLLNFDTGKISVKIDDTVIPDITMNDGLKAGGITHISFMGCKNIATNRQTVCNCALIDNLLIKHQYTEYDYNPGVTGVRFIEKDGTEKIAIDTISPLTEKILVKFSKEVKTTELDKIAITNGTSSVGYIGEFNDDTNAWEMTIPEGTLEVKTEYAISVPDTICDLKGYKLACEYECTFKTGSNTRSTNIEYINSLIAQNDKQGLAGLLADDPEGIGIAADVFGAADKLSVAELILTYSDGNHIEDSDETIKALQKLVLIDCANNKRTQNLWSKDFTYGVSDARVFELMEQRLVGYITEKLSGKNITTIEAFDNALRDSVIICAINYADGKESVKNVLTVFEDEISDGSGLNLTDEKCEAIYEKGDFNSISSLKNFADNYTPEDEGGSGTPSGGGLGLGGGGGGFVSSSTDKAANAADNKLYKGEEEEKEEVRIFDDIVAYPWAEEAINELFAMGVINGREKNLFVPDANVLREETAKIIVEAFKFYIKGSISFEDVDKDDWFYPYIVRAFNSGVVNGISDTMFGSGQPIIRQDLAVMVYNAMIAADVLPTETGEKGQFIDNAEISDYAYDAVYALKNEGIISGDEDGAFNPKSFASRAETAKIVYLATKYLK